MLVSVRRVFETSSAVASLLSEAFLFRRYCFSVLWRLSINGFYGVSLNFADVPT